MKIPKGRTISNQKNNCSFCTHNLKEKNFIFNFIFKMMSPLFAAVKGGHTEVVRFLLPRSDINETSTDGTTLLHMAVSLGHSEITRMLLNDKRIDVNIQNADGKSALHFAVYANQVECLELLLAYRNPISHL